MEPRLKLAYLLNQMTSYLNQEANVTLQKHYDVGYVHFLTLVGISYLQPCTQKQLAEFVQMTSAGVLHTLRSLEERGWVKKEVLPENQRSSQITLTPRGEEALVAMNSLLSQRLAHLVIIDEGALELVNSTLEKQLKSLHQSQSGRVQ